LLIKPGNPLSKFNSRFKGSVTSREVVPAQVVDATPSDTTLHLKGGVYDASETMETFRDAEERAVGSLEGGTVIA
jgi:hypothetical protein